MNVAKLKRTVSELMLENRRNSKGFQYTVPSPQSYPYQWFWDSCFHAIIYVRLGQLDDAKKELLALVSKQFKNGMIPHMIYWEKQTRTDFPVVEWGKGDTSTIIQPPMLAYAVWEIYKKEKSKNFLRQIYKPMERFYGYLLEERDLRSHHLISIINPDESGEDDSPRFDIPLGLPPRHSSRKNFARRLELIGKNLSCDFEAKKCMSNFFWVKDVPFNAILVENLSILSRVARELGNEEDALYYASQRKHIVNSMRRLMLENGIFWTVYRLDYKKIKVKTWAMFAPLFARLYTKKQAQVLLEKYLLNTEEFNATYLVPTVSRSDPSYDPRGFWRGPAWMATNWFIYRGLLNYNFEKIAQKVSQSSLALIMKSGFREHFNPETGQGLGAKDFTWGGLVLDMLETV